MMLTQNVKRRNVAYARYQRALMVLVFFPITVWREVVNPCRAGAACIAAVVGMALLSGWMYREAIRWWENAPAPED